MSRGLGKLQRSIIKLLKGLEVSDYFDEPVERIFKNSEELTTWEIADELSAAGIFPDERSDRQQNATRVNRAMRSLVARKRVSRVKRHVAEHSKKVWSFALVTKRSD